MTLWGKPGEGDFQSNIKILVWLVRICLVQSQNELNQNFNITLKIRLVFGSVLIFDVILKILVTSSCFLPFVGFVQMAKSFTKIWRDKKQPSSRRGRSWFAVASGINCMISLTNKFEMIIFHKLCI